MERFILGFIICGLIGLILFFARSKIAINDDLVATQIETVRLLKDTTIRKTSLQELNIRLANFEEKLNSVNKRFDDLYILGGIIITLLLAINVGIFLKTETEVDKYFKKNYDTHLKLISDYEKDAASQLGKINTYVAGIEKKYQDVTDQTIQEPAQEPGA